MFVCGKRRFKGGNTPLCTVRCNHRNAQSESKMIEETCVINGVDTQTYTEQVEDMIKFRWLRKFTLLLVMDFFMFVFYIELQ